jgi:MFS family permease
MSGDNRTLRVVVPLGVTQTIAWGSSYYICAILAEPIARDLAVTPTYVYAALSGALVIAGLLGPRVGTIIDTVGGRGLLCVTNIVFAAGLALLAASYSLTMLVLAWVVLGIGMGAGLYEAAFATLTRLYGHAARSPITGITLLAGFASTVSWPLTTWLNAGYGWRTACLVWAAIHLLIALPLNLALPRPTTSALAENDEDAIDVTSKAAERRAMILVAYIFAAVSFVSVGLSAVLPALLVSLGATPAAALFASTLVGPAQVAARIVEASVLKRFHPLTSTRLATVLHPLGALLIAATGPVSAAAFAILYGAGNGIITIARGTLPLALFGPVGFGRRTGLIAMPARLLGAIAPLVLGFAMQSSSSGILWMTSLLSLSALAVLFVLRPHSARAH